MILLNALNLVFLVSWVRAYQEWDSTQQLVYDIGSEQLSEVFIHFDNQTLTMKGNKSMFKCVQKVKDLTLHCIDTIAIQWQIKGYFLKALQMNETELQEAMKYQLENTAVAEDLLNQTMETSQQLICCVLSELFDCMEYSIRKECNDNAFEELKQIHTLIAAEAYSCQSGQRTEFCNKMLKQRQENDKKGLESGQNADPGPKSTSGQCLKSIRFLVIMFHLFISFFVFIK